MRFWVCLILSLCLSTQAQAQLNLIEAPISEAFLPQNRITRSAKISLKGEVTQSGYQQINIKILRNNVLIANHAQMLNYVGSKADFSQDIELGTGKYKYTIKYELSGPVPYSYEVNDILVGDVYIIQGQSNAVAGSYNPFNTNYYSDYIRSFGTASRNAGTVGADTFFHPINAINPGRQGSVGQWGAVLARNLLDSFDTPICLFNGAVGGTNIYQHQPNLTNREDLNTIYGRLLYRVRKANLDSNIAGILYFQGESDGWNANGHNVGFTNLHQYWTQDYPEFKKLYVVQVRDGCGNPTLQLREVQRQFEFKLPNCQTVSANGLNNHDNCHYGFANGYEKLGYQLSKLVARDYYWPKEITNIDPPNIHHCYYSDGLQREIKLVMRSTSDLVFVDPNFHTLFELEGDNSVQIVGGKLENNIITLQLSKSSCNLTGLSYNGKRGVQPWVTNKTGMGLISFYNQPIRNFSINKNVVTCKGANSTIGVASQAGISYSIEQLSNGNKKESSSMRVLLTKKDSFMVRMQFDSLNCPKSDSVVIYTDVDPVIIPYFGMDTALCVGDSLELNPNSNGFKNFIWFYDSKIHSKLDWTAKESGTVRLDALSLNGCSYSDEIDVRFQEPSIKLDSVYEICKGKSATVDLHDTFATIFWDNLKGTSSFTSDQTGAHSVYVVDDIGCTAIDSFRIQNFVSKISPTWDSVICANATIRINKPKHALKWLRNGNELGAGFYLLGEQHIPMVLIDSNRCELKDTIDLTPYQSIDYPTQIDTAICSDDTLHIQLPTNMLSYNFNNNGLSKPNISATQMGTYSYGFLDTNHCNFIGALTINSLPNPDLSIFRDTAICAKDSLRVQLNPNYLYWINGIPASDPIYLKPDKLYALLATNDKNCTNTKDVSIQSIDCSSTIKSVDWDNQHTVYPNPFTSILRIQSQANPPTYVAIYTMEGRLIWQQNAHLNKDLEIHLEQLSDGFYLLQIDNAFKPIVKRKE